MADSVPVEFWDESTWVRYFRDELGAFYAALAGFLEARRASWAGSPATWRKS